MFETLLSSLTATSALSISLADIVTAIAAALIVGIMVSFTYQKTHEGRPSGNLMMTLILLPAVISVIIMLIGSDVAKAFSLAGAFSIIRFRSAPGEPKDIAYILFTLAGGLAAGAGVPLYAIVFTLILCAVMFALNLLGIAKEKESTERLLQITIPEDLDYEGALNEVLSSYTDSYRLEKVKMSAMGSLYTLQYAVQLAEKTDIKEFIDTLRTRNGNLAINLHLATALEG